jgi:hypothetical protein
VSLVAEATTCIDTNDRLRADNGHLFHNPGKGRVADQPGTTPFVDRSAFVGINPMDELINSHLPATGTESHTVPSPTF